MQVYKAHQHTFKQNYFGEPSEHNSVPLMPEQVETFDGENITQDIPVTLQQMPQAEQSFYTCVCSCLARLHTCRLTHGLTSRCLMGQTEG